MADFIKDTLEKIPGVDPRIGQRSSTFSGMNEGECSIGLLQFHRHLGLGGSSDGDPPIQAPHRTPPVSLDSSRAKTRSTTARTSEWYHVCVSCIPTAFAGSAALGPSV